MTELASRLVAPADAMDAAAFWLIKRDRGVALESDPGFTAWLAASQAHAAVTKSLLPQSQGTRSSKGICAFS